MNFPTWVSVFRFDYPKREMSTELGLSKWEEWRRKKRRSLMGDVPGRLPWTLFSGEGPTPCSQDNTYFPSQHLHTILQCIIHWLNSQSVSYWDFSGRNKGRRDWVCVAPGCTLSISGLSHNKCSEIIWQMGAGMNECRRWPVDCRALPQDVLLSISCQDVCVLVLVPCQLSDFCSAYISH